MNDILERIIVLIDKLGISRNKFTKSLGYSHVAFINWEKGKSIGDKTLRLICHTYKVNPSWLSEIFSDSFSEDDNLSSAQMLVINAVKKMDDDEAKLLLKYIDEFASSEKSSENTNNFKKKLG